jgi:GTPase
LLIKTINEENVQSAFKQALDPGVKLTMTEDDGRAGLVIAVTDVGAIAGVAVKNVTTALCTELSADAEQASTTANLYEVLAVNPVAMHVVLDRLTNGAPVQVTRVEGVAAVVDEYTTHDANEVPVP